MEFMRWTIKEGIENNMLVKKIGTLIIIITGLLIGVLFGLMYIVSQVKDSVSSQAYYWSQNG